MVRDPFDGADLDRLAYEAADEHFRRLGSVLPDDAVEHLAREVVRRLAFRMPRSVPPDHLPSQTEIDHLCAALLSTDERAGDRIILAARRDGVPPEVIYLSYVAGAARRLGKMWEADEVSFVDVTIASGRLYRIIRGLRHVIDRAADRPGRDRSILFALVPDETHTLGIEMATDLFRRDGWDVTLSVGDPHDTVVARSDQERFEAVILVAHSERRLADLISLVLAMRITQPCAHVIVAGNIVEQIADVDRIVGADAVIDDLETAIRRLSDIVDPSGGTDAQDR